VRSAERDKLKAQERMLILMVKRSWGVKEGILGIFIFLKLKEGLPSRVRWFGANHKDGRV